MCDSPFAVEQGLLLIQSDIMRHVYEFYIQLLGSEEPKLAGLRTDLWDPSQQVSEVENDALTLAFLPRKMTMRWQV